LRIVNGSSHTNTLQLVSMNSAPSFTIIMLAKNIDVSGILSIYRWQYLEKILWRQIGFLLAINSLKNVQNKSYFNLHSNQLRAGSYNVNEYHLKVSDCLIFLLNYIFLPMFAASFMLNEKNSLLPVSTHSKHKWSFLLLLLNHTVPGLLH
jgi:hypothetical protein